jgi:two-component system sensor histidine kinase KdpD
VLFHSVLVNLLDNAVKYTPAGTPVELVGRRAGGDPEVGAGRVELIVADRGPGLAAGELERIFEKFVRGSTYASQRGVGLGLTICKSIVEAHGGTIRARARDGGGAEFVISLPAVAARSDPGS